MVMRSSIMRRRRRPPFIGAADPFKGATVILESTDLSTSTVNMSDEVTTWGDISGNGNDFTGGAGQTGVRTLGNNNINALDFDNSDGYNFGAHQIGDTRLFCGAGDEFSFLSIGSFDGTSTGYLGFTVAGGGVSTRQFGVFVDPNSSDKINVFLRGNDPAVKFDYTSQDAIMVAGYWNGSAFKISINGGAFVEMTVGSAAEETAQNVCLNCRTNDTGYQLNGANYCNVLFDSAVSEAQLYALMNHYNTIGDFGFSVNTIDSIDAHFVFLGASIIRRSFEQSNGDLQLFIDDINSDYSVNVIATERAVEGRYIAELQAEIDDILATIPDAASVNYETHVLVHCIGNDISDGRPYSTDPNISTIESDLDYVLDAIDAKGFNLILPDVTFRDYDGTTAANEENGSLPYNENIIRPRVPADWKHVSGKPIVQLYDFVYQNRATILGGDNIHMTGPGEDTLREYITGVIGDKVFLNQNPTEIT